MKTNPGDPARLSVSEYVVPVPGEFQPGIAYLDLETQKVPTKPLFVMKNGENLRQRWSVIMAGIARDGQIALIDGEGEEGVLDGISIECWSADEVVYAATREFDEMIVKGRFTNARRAHEDVPFYPAAFAAESWKWRNLGPIPSHFRNMRVTDIPGKAVPGLMSAGKSDVVMVHLLRDVVTLILMDGNPDPVCERWIKRVLAYDKFARDEIFKGDE
jgi:hypothetical protein